MWVGDTVLSAQPPEALDTVSTHSLPVFDSDSHVDEDHAAIATFLARRPGRAEPMFPSGDGWSRGTLVDRGDPQRRYRSTSAEIFAEVLATVGLDASVLYPTEGLACGLMQDIERAVAATRAWNDWLEAEYTKKDDRLLGVLMLPIQDPAACVEMLRTARARKGFVAALLPSVVAMPRTYGDPFFWPIYEEAQRQRLPVALHGGPAGFAGVTHFTDFAKVHTLSHPVPMLTQVTDIVLSGVFDAFPDLRVVCLEAGCGWVPWWLDRLDHEYQTLNGLALRKRLKHRPSHYFCETDNVWMSFELDERTLRFTLDVVGSERLVYASDYGHETKFDVIVGDLEEFIAAPSFADDVKRRLLAANGRRLYGV